MAPKPTITKFTNIHRHGKYLIFDYETDSQPGVLRTQRLRKWEAIRMVKQLVSQFAGYDCEELLRRLDDELTD